VQIQHQIVQIQHQIVQIQHQIVQIPLTLHHNTIDLERKS